MSYPLPTQEQIRDAILIDWRNSDSLVEVAVDSDNHIRASGIASAVLGLYQFAGWGINQYFPDTADVENLVRFASVRGINQLQAVNAIGSITFTGTVAAAVPIGTLVQTVNGVQYKTSVASAIGAGGNVTVAAIATVAGIAGNQPDNTAVTLLSAPAGINAAAVLTHMADGYDAESLASLLERVLDHLRHPPAGGNANDYRRWAREVAGVTSAFVYPLRRGLGTTDVVILSNGAPASNLLQNTVRAYIDDRSPAGGDFSVLTPSLVTVAISATVALAAGTLLANVQASVQSALATYFSTLAPGDTVNRSRARCGDYFMSTHADLLKALLPPVAYDKTGIALNAELLAEGTRLDDFQTVVKALLLEIDPRTTTQLLPDWERTYGLPDLGLTLPQSIADRQVLLAAKVGATGGLSKPYFRALLEAAGYTVFIDQPRGFFAGVNRCGDRLYDITKVTWYWRIRIRKNGQPITADQRTQVKTWINSVKPSFSFFDLED